MRSLILLAAAALAFAGCDPERSRQASPRVEALAPSAWEGSEWLSVKDAPVVTGEVRDGVRAADGTSWFLTEIENEAEVVSAKWMTVGLGVYEVYVNGRPVGDDFLKPGFTDNRKTKYSFTYDVTKLFRTGKGEANRLSAEVSTGWWSDKICTPHRTNGFFGKKSAFRGVLELTFADGTRKLYGTNVRDWRAGVAGPVTHAAIFDGEEYDARRPKPCLRRDRDRLAEPEVNREFKGQIHPTAGAEVVVRRDLAMPPVRAYAWKGVEGAGPDVFGKVKVVREFDPDDDIRLEPGETLIADFGQNAAAVPAFVFKADEGTVVTVLPGEMLNEANGEKKRGNDGPAGSIYRQNLRSPSHGMRVVYTFGKDEGFACYCPRFTFFGFRYVSVTATAPVVFRRIWSVPVTSIARALETGRIETGVKDVNRLIANVRWGQRSNYLSIPTDCPQRNERLGWTADTEVFCEAGTFNADTRAFFRKWMRDMRDNQGEKGGFPGVAPFGQYGNEPMRIGWADAGVIVPYTIWKQFGDKTIIEENWQAMEKFVDRIAETKYQTKLLPECGNYQWADWLSFEKLESCGGGAFDKNGPKADALLYWDYLGACYWIRDARMMAWMARATGRDMSKFKRMEAEARAYVKGRFFASADGMILPVFREMQTPAVFALNLGLVEGEAKAKTIAALKANFKAHGDCLQTGFLGTSILMDTLTENGMADIAYTLLLQHGHPSWLYSVDQGATTIWERWNSYVKATGFGPVGMNSFNHYAYGSVLAWIYKTAAGIAADPEAPGFANIVMKPVPDPRLGHVKAEYKTPHGLVKSAWRYDEDGNWTWEFTVPRWTTASVTVPGETAARAYGPGDYRIERPKKK